MKRLVLSIALLAGAARAQTIVDQEQRLIQIHSLLVALDEETAPGAYRPGELSLGVQLIVIPDIDGSVGNNKRLTASDQTPVFPRPRLAIGLPAPEDFRAFVGISYVPPIEINDVSSHQGAIELGYAWTPPGPWSIGLRGYALFAESKSPVTDLTRQSRDTLDSFDAGGEVSAGYKLELDFLTATPFVGAGVAYVNGNFRVTTDHDLLTANSVNLALNGGVRVRLRPGIEALAEVVSYPGVMTHPVFGLAWNPDFLVKH